MSVTFLKFYLTSQEDRGNTSFFIRMVTQFLKMNWQQCGLLGVRS